MDSSGGRASQSDGRHLRIIHEPRDTAWITRALRPFSDYCVGSQVPPVFEAYARVLHPASAKGPSAHADDWLPVRWDAIAASSGAGLILMHSRGEFESMHSQPP